MKNREDKFIILAMVFYIVASAAVLLLSERNAPGEWKRVTL